MKNLFSVEEKLLSLPVVTAKFGAMMARGFVENGARVYITAREIDEL
jgi:NADP-dependent 3-hydroxy acid dehydrogenase YdfG